MDFRFMILPAAKRAAITNEVAHAVTHGRIQHIHIDTGEGRLGLLEKAISWKMTNPNMSYAEIIANIENTQD